MLKRRFPWLFVICALVVLGAGGVVFLVVQKARLEPEWTEPDTPEPELSEDEQEIRSVIEDLVTAVRESRGRELLNLVNVERMLEEGAKIVEIPGFERESRKKKFLSDLIGAIKEFPTKRASGPSKQWEQLRITRVYIAEEQLEATVFARVRFPKGHADAMGV